MLKKTILTALLFFTFLFVLSITTTAAVCSPNIDVKNKSPEELAEIISACESKLKDIRSRINSLSSEISYMNTQIYLTQLKINSIQRDINKLKEQIEILDSRIEDLDFSLDHLSQVFIRLAEVVYKARPKPIFTQILLSNNFNEFLLRYKYLKTKQIQNQRLMLQIQKTKLNFEEQKKIREEKTKELANLNALLKQQKENLKNQQKAKQKLLEITQNDEKKYQLILSRARAEYQAILAIVAGRGTEKKVKDVKKGELIAYIIQGPSCNSSGSHLHFIVKENGVVKNPFSFLKPIDHINCSGSSCGSSDGDPFNPSGNWDWPLTAPVKLYQGFGYTWAVRHTWVGRIYRFHNGLDIYSENPQVRAVADGELYRGSFTGSKGCALPYVRLVHKEGNFETYYLHVYSKY